MKFMFKDICSVCQKSVVSDDVEASEEVFEELLKNNSSNDSGKDKATGYKVIYRKLEGACPLCLDTLRKKAIDDQVTAAKKAVTAEADANLAIYAIESVCGGSSAAGGGCGGPKGVVIVSRKSFEKLPVSKIFTSLQEHNDHEVGREVVDASDTGRLRLRLMFSPCLSCRVL